MFFLSRWLAFESHSQCLKPLPQMPILGSSNSAVNKDMMSKIWTNGDTTVKNMDKWGYNYLIE